MRNLFTFEPEAFDYAGLTRRQATKVEGGFTEEAKDPMPNLYPPTGWHGDPNMPNPAKPPQPIVSPPQILLVRSRVQCTAAQIAAIQNVVGPGIVITDAIVRQAIQSAHDNVFSDLTDPGMPPRQSLASPRNMLTPVRFKSAFGRSPEDLPWRGARWDLGRIVAARFGGARVTMFSSSIRISCFGWVWSGGGVDRPADYMVKTLPKRERVALGALFWRSFATGDVVSQGAAMVIAGLVIRYGVSYRMLAPPLRNIHCYIKYGLLMLRHPIPQWVENKCRAEVV
jgi:hypothetical protein